MLRLSPVLDLGAAAPLWRGLCEARGAAIEIDASQVERIGGLCLQVLLAARTQWRADGRSFAIVQPSAAFADGVRLMAAADLAPQQEDVQ
ncbi:MAG: STAS domain-containing protein [Hyphomonadaceae bacterium]|nr:STAS domain-containing protein [Hyphomonadaceae bacterium]